MTEYNKLEERLGQVWEIAKKFGLDPHPTHFEIIPPEMMHEIGSTGLPDRFSHWTHGKAYRQLKTQYDYGLGTIYEVVINSIPSRAFLLENNSDLENTTVMAHVLGHTDFFKNNYQFTKTRKDLPHAAAVNASRIREYEYQHGSGLVEHFLDAALSIAEHVDPFQMTRLPKDDQLKNWKDEFEMRQRPKQGTGEFDDLLDKSSRVEALETAHKLMTVPLHPDKDLLGFIADFAPYLEDWQRDVLHIVRMESLYFHPQGRTKIMNEGWATYWHKRIMREMSNKGLLDQEEQMRWIVMHTGVVTPTTKGLNPYYFGMSMFDFIEDYHNGNLEDAEKRWLEKEGLPIYPKTEGDYVGTPGQKKVREVMISDDDQSFVRNYFNKIPADRMNMFVYEEREIFDDKKITVITDRGWERIRDSLVSSMDNSGHPYLVIADADYNRSQELYIKHLYGGQELDIEYLRKTLPHLYTLWGRPIHIETAIASKSIVFTFDGQKFESKQI